MNTYQKYKESIKQSIKRYHLSPKGKAAMVRASRKMRKKYPWYRTMLAIRKRCRKEKAYKHVKVKISIPQLRFLWLSCDASFMKQPSIDRIDPNGHYEFSNCRYIEKTENKRRYRKRPFFP